MTITQNTKPSSYYYPEVGSVIVEQINWNNGDINFYTFPEDYFEANHRVYIPDNGSRAAYFRIKPKPDAFKNTD